MAKAGKNYSSQRPNTLRGATKKGSKGGRSTPRTNKPVKFAKGKK